MDIGDPGGMDFVDMACGARWAKENVATEIALAGYSYGGYSTLYGLGKEPELWACGVAGAPVADWKEMYELSDAAFRSFIEILFDRKTELYSERSPIAHVKNVKKPICIITSQNDSRTPMTPVLRYAMALQANGAKFELHSVPDMGHTIRTTKDMMDIVFPMIMFLQREFPATSARSAAD
jgi:dipeptidyl aminopeptidase/acylaminoacyl peptidase